MVKQHNYFKFFLIFILLFDLGCASFHSSVKPKKQKIIGIYHRVEKGETIWSIAELYQVPAENIVRINDYHKIKRLEPGTLIFIPGITKKLSAKIPFDESTKTEIKYKTDFIFPVEGKIISYFGIRNGKKHQGIDIKAPLETKIKAISEGIIVYSDDKMRGYGKVIIIKHKNDFYSVYAHNKENLVKTGQKVTSGQIVALVGQTGRASCPQLHFEIRYKGKCLDPLLFFPKYK